MNPQLNKKVKKYLDSYFRDTKTNSPEHQEAVMLVMRGALTDANFHSEAKELGKYFPKASKKYIGTPMEGVIEDKGIDIAKMAKWDGHDIIDAFAFYLSMSIGGSFGNRLMSLKESLEESLVSEGERLDEKNCPTDASKWSYYKSQAKKKFDVYPSAYANGWASKQYKSAGGGWKACKKESVNEKMVAPKNGHAYYKLTKDTLIKYISGHSGIGLKVPGVLLHNEYSTIKGKKGAYIINYFGAHFYVDMKNKFASRIANPQNREQNKDLMKNVERVFSAPEHSDWKKYMNESVNEAKDKVFVVMFKDKKDLPNRNIKPSSVAYAKETDAKKFLKSVEKDGGKGMIVKSNKPVGVKVNEVASRTAMEIGGLTGMNKDAIQKFVDDNKLDIEKVYQFVKKGKLADRMKLVSAIAGKPNNSVQKKMVKQFSESLIKEAKVKLGKDVVNFRVSPNVKDVGLTLLAASSNDLDKLQDAITNDVDVKSELLKMLEKQLKLPMNIDYDYQGAGFAFKFDLYSIAKKVK